MFENVCVWGGIGLHVFEPVCVCVCVCVEVVTTLDKDPLGSERFESDGGFFLKGLA